MKIQRPMAEELAEFITSTSYKDIPAKTIEKAKLCLLDYLGCAIGGALEHEIKLMVNFVNSINGVKESTIIAYPHKVPAPLATFVNGGMGHVLQLDDGDRWTLSHVGTAIIPAALATCEREKCSGKELITAIILGYEVAMRIGYAINPSHFNRGFSPNSTLGIFGSTVAAGKILRLDNKQFADALGSAGTMASGVEEFVIDGSASQVLNPGHASMDGVIAALLAREGFTGSHTIIEGRRGFAKAFSDQYDLSKILENLGKEYQIEKVYFKPYPTCRGFHSAIDILLSIIEKENLKPKDIKEVVVKTYRYLIDTMCSKTPPKTPGHARLHMPYALACAIVKRRVFVDEFTEQALKDQEILKTMNKIKFVVADEELNKFAPYPWGAEITVITTDGKKYTAKESLPKGEPENPLTYEELKQKFTLLAQRVISDRNRIKEIIQRVENIEKAHNAYEHLISLLSI